MLRGNVRPFSFTNKEAARTYFLLSCFSDLEISYLSIILFHFLSYPLRGASSLFRGRETFGEEEDRLSSLLNYPEAGTDLCKTDRYDSSSRFGEENLADGASSGQRGSSGGS